MTAGPKSKGGRPVMPAPPRTAEEIRLLYGQEILKTKPNSTKLRHFEKLLKFQQQAEQHATEQEAAEEANRLLAEKNRLAAEEKEQKRA